MRYQKVTALIAGFVFVASTMTACGVYGSAEVSVYGAMESMTAYEPGDGEEVEVYGPMEDYGAYDVESHMPFGGDEKEGFDETTNVETQIGFEIFQIPFYMQQEDVGEDGTTSYLVEKQSDEVYGRLTFSPVQTLDSLNLTQDEMDMLSVDSELICNDYGNILCERMLDELWQEYGYDRTTDDNKDQSLSDADETGDILPDYYGQPEELDINGRDVFCWAIDYTLDQKTVCRYVTVLLDEEQKNYMVVTLEMTEGLDYCYANDFFHILESAQFSE